MTVKVYLDLKKTKNKGDYLMGKTIVEIKELIDKAHTTRNEATGVYRAWRQKYDEEAGKIRASRELTPEGKDKMLAALNKRKEIEVMKLADSQVSLYRKFLDDAYKAADKIAYAKLPEVDAQKAERWEKQFGELKTQVLLANPQKALQMISDFVAATDEQALVDRVRHEYSQIIAQADAPTRYKFSDLFEETKTKALGPEAVEALRVMESAEGLRNGRFWSGIVGDNVGAVSQTAQHHLENPESYFAENPGAANVNTTLRSMEESLLSAEYGQ